MSSFFNSILDFAYPPKCGLCGRIPSAAICESCLALLEPAGNLGQKQGVESYAVFQYRKLAGEAVRKLKYERVVPLGYAMAECVFKAWSNDPSWQDWTIVPIPIHWTRRMIRGFNQSELLVSKFPVQSVEENLLVRTRRTRPQASLPKHMRSHYLADAFRGSAECAGKRIVLVDDVVTTGSTAYHCAEALKKAGALEVRMIAFAGVGNTIP